MSNDKSTFILVHGAWSGGWSLRALADRLTTRGHTVYRPTLTGLGERSHLAHADVDINTHIADIVNIIRWEELKSVVLVAHSYGGTVISGVPEKVAPGIIRSIVFIDASYPADGESHFDHTGRTEFPEDELMAVPGGGVDADGKPWPGPPRTAQPLATFTQPLKLTGARERIAKKTFIAGSESIVRDRPAIITIKNDPTWRYVELPSGHNVPQALPDETADELERAAQ